MSINGVAPSGKISAELVASVTAEPTSQRPAGDSTAPLLTAIEPIEQVTALTLAKVPSFTVAATPGALEIRITPPPVLVKEPLVVVAVTIKSLLVMFALPPAPAAPAATLTT